MPWLRLHASSCSADITKQQSAAWSKRRANRVRHCLISLNSAQRSSCASVTTGCLSCSHCTGGSRIGKLESINRNEGITAQATQKFPCSYLQLVKQGVMRGRLTCHIGLGHYDTCCFYDQSCGVHIRRFYCCFDRVPNHCGRKRCNVCSTSHQTSVTRYQNMCIDGQSSM